MKIAYWENGRFTCDIEEAKKADNSRLFDSKHKIMEVPEGLMTSDIQQIVDELIKEAQAEDHYQKVKHTMFNQD